VSRPPRFSRSEAPALVCNLLQKKSAPTREELSARWVAKALGQTTGTLYHHWGSFDAFLLEVSGIGWQRLVASVVAAYENEPTARTLVRSYIEFALAHPVLYWLLAERPLPRDLVRERLARGEALPSHVAFQDFVRLLGRLAPEGAIDLAGARALHAAAHGLASQLLSGRLVSTPDVAREDERVVAHAVADAIVQLTGLDPPRRR